MPHAFAENRNKLTNVQLEFLKSLKYMATEQQLSDIRSLLRHYFAQQLDISIEKAEREKGYTAAIYESWLKNRNDDGKSSAK